MIRNFKALGISLVAMLAMSALGASTASAVDVVTTGTSPALLTGVSDDHVFRITNPSLTERARFECTTSKFAATVNSGDSEITADVTYDGKKNITPHTADCTSSTGEAKVDTTGCGYILTGNTTASHGGGLDAPVWIECEGTNVIKITNTSPAITVTVPPQTPTSGSAGGGVTYTNVPSHNGNSAVKVTATVTGVTYTCAPTFTCTLGLIPHHGNNSDYNGTVTMTAYEDKNKAGEITPAVPNVNEGARISLVSS